MIDSVVMQLPQSSAGSVMPGGLFPDGQGECALGSAFRDLLLAGLVDNPIESLDATLGSGPDSAEAAKPTDEYSEASTPAAMLILQLAAAPHGTKVLPETVRSESVVAKEPSTTSSPILPQATKLIETPRLSAEQVTQPIEFADGIWWTPNAAAALGESLTAEQLSSLEPAVERMDVPREVLTVASSEKILPSENFGMDAVEDRAMSTSTELRLKNVLSPAWDPNTATKANVPAGAILDDRNAADQNIAEQGVAKPQQIAGLEMLPDNQPVEGFQLRSALHGSDEPAAVPVSNSRLGAESQLRDEAVTGAHSHGSEPPRTAKFGQSLNTNDSGQPFVRVSSASNIKTEPNLNIAAEQLNGLPSGQGDDVWLVDAALTVEDRPDRAKAPRVEVVEHHSAAQAPGRFELSYRAAGEVTATRTAHTQQPEAELRQTVIDQVVRAVSLHRFPDKTHMVVKLHPPELGSLSIRVTQDVQGLTSQIQATNESVRNLLQANLPMLADALADAGVRVNSVTVTSDLSFGTLMHDSAQGSAREQYQAPRQTYRGVIETAPVPESYDSPAALVGSAGYSWLA